MTHARPSRASQCRAIIAAIAVAGYWLAPGGSAWAFNAIYTFGDSLTDTGRNAAPPVAYYNGRYSNGPLWVEYLSGKFGLAYNPANNYAESGAQTDDTLAQVTRFGVPQDADKALFVVWAGGNDFLQTYDENLFNDEKWTQHIEYGVNCVSNAVINLYQKGARTVLVPNTVDVTVIPSLNWLPGFYRDYLRGKVNQFNSQLAYALDEISADKPLLRLLHVDFFAQVNGLLSNYTAFGFAKADVDALSDFTLLDKRFDGPGKDYVFWDPIHPTTKSHSIVAEWFYATVAGGQAPRLELSSANNSLALDVYDLQPGQSYLLERSEDLVNWAVDQTVFATATTVHLPVDASASRLAFFRLRSGQ